MQGIAGRYAVLCIVKYNARLLACDCVKSNGEMYSFYDIIYAYINMI